MSTSLGFIWKSSKLPIPDINDDLSVLLGVYKRVTPEMSPKQKTFFDVLVSVADKEINKLIPLAHDTDISLETFLLKVPWPERKKTKVRNAGESPLPWKVKPEYSSFNKEESYTEPKFNRAIQAPTPLIKALFGPVIRAIEESLCSQTEFMIKKVPVLDRAAYIEELFRVRGEHLCSSDFSSFEVQFTHSVKKVIENKLFTWMTSKLSNSLEINNYYQAFVRANTKLDFGSFVVILLEAIRQSGDMWTSIFNSFSNYIIHLSMSVKLGNKNFKCVVEGDDGLFSFDGVKPTEQDYLDMGFKVKLINENKLNLASFCGLVYDDKTFRIMTDPIQILSDFGWSGSRYLGANHQTKQLLLRAKALSFLYQYPGMPIVSELCKKVITLTSSKGIRRLVHRGHFSEWERQQLIEALDHPPMLVNPEPSQRDLMHEKYEISPEAQLSIENRIRQLTEIPVSFSYPELDMLIPLEWSWYAQRFIVDNTTPDLFNIPYSQFKATFDFTMSKFLQKGGKVQHVY